MSIPRDLKVAIPGHGVEKINAAYSYGGAKLTLETVKQLTGLRINHVINIDFSGFVNAVNELGCVYLDIDRKYFNSGLGFDSTPPSTSSPATSASAGATRSRSCASATPTRTSCAPPASRSSWRRRSSRSASASSSASARSCSTIFGKATQTDIRSQAAVLRLLKLVLASAGHPSQEVHVSGPRS